MGIRMLLAGSKQGPLQGCHEVCEVLLSPLRNGLYYKDKEGLTACFSFNISPPRLK